MRHPASHTKDTCDLIEIWTTPKLPAWNLIHLFIYLSIFAIHLTLMNVGLGLCESSNWIKGNRSRLRAKAQRKHPSLACFEMTRRLGSGVIKTAENIIGAHLQSIRDIDEAPAQDPKDSKLQHPPSRSLFALPRKKHLSQAALDRWAESSSFSLFSLTDHLARVSGLCLLAFCV